MEYVVSHTVHEFFPVRACMEIRKLSTFIKLAAVVWWSGFSQSMTALSSQRMLRIALIASLLAAKLLSILCSYHPICTMITNIFIHDQ